MNKTRLLLSLVFSFLALGIYGKPVRGTVSDGSGAAVIGASVVIDGSGEGTITDMDGLFTIDASPGSVLSVSYVGYKTRQITIQANKDTYSLVLEEDTEVLEDVVVIDSGESEWHGSGCAGDQRERSSG